MKSFLNVCLTVLCVALSVASLNFRGLPNRSNAQSQRMYLPRQAPLQDVVTWDEYSLKIDGERLMIFSGEVHPYRMPVHSLYLDVFQKIKSMGLNTVSFYVFWGIHEAKKGDISFEGFRDLQPFFDAAKEAGLYLIARPGPYINAETTAGGFPGWGTRDPSVWRTSNTSYTEAYQGYMKAVGSVIAKNQITEGGPVILIQSENEYSGFAPGYSEDFQYEKDLIDIIRSSGIVIPITTNDAKPGGVYLSIDLYGYDSYPNGFDCSHPTVWQKNAVPESSLFWGSHLNFNPEDLYAIYEFQGGAFDGWGGSGYDTCSVLTGPEFERVFYKNQIAMSTTIFNLYMIYGGTNWGGIAHPGVYTSYDYGSAIAEDRTLREKYYELKLQANFLAATPAYLTSQPQNWQYNIGAFTGNSALRTIQTRDVVGNQTTFYTVRHNDSSTFDTTKYKLTIPDGSGNITIPSLGGELTLVGKDSKVHVVNYQAGGTTLLYSTAEIFSWATFDNKDFIVIYGNEGELHETAIKFNDTASNATASAKSGSDSVKSKTLDDGSLVVQYTISGQTVVEIGTATLFILDRKTAYEFWVLYPAADGQFAHYSKKNPVIIKGGYYLRSVSTTESGIALQGDLNETASFEIIAPSKLLSSVSFNGEDLDLKKTEYGTVTASKNANLPSVTLPDLSSATWKTSDSLPEISGNYSDAKWTTADLTNTTNPTKLTTPVNLFSGDYGYHTGNILFRGHFNASGSETGFNVEVQGGAAFAYSVWLDSAYLGSWVGNSPNFSWPLSLKFPESLSADSEHVLTVLQDHMGYEEDWVVATETFKAPRGILNYTIAGGENTNITWKLTGNLGGEDYADKTRGPLNEGGLFGERQGWHLPGFDDSTWEAGSPTEGISKPGVSFYRTTFDLDIPTGVDYPVALVTSNATSNSHFRSQLYVNGYQFGKYINSIGPQISFPIPQGVLDYKGTNTLAVSLWATDDEGAKLNSLGLEFRAKLESSMAEIKNLPFTAWEKRPAAY